VTASGKTEIYLNLAARALEAGRNVILLVPENPDVNLPRFRRDQSDSDGTFTLRDVMPGHYRIVALDNAWDAEWANGSVLKGRLEHAQSADVQAGRSYELVVGVE